MTQIRNYHDICISIEKFKKFFKAPKTALHTPETRKNKYTLNKTMC